MTEDIQEEAQEELEDLEPVESLGREESLQALYALLFASDRPLSSGRLAEALGDVDKEIVETLLGELRDAITMRPELPYTLREIAGGYQLVSKPEFGLYIRRLFQIKKSNRMSKALLETLAIIAYKQPVTRAEVEAVRGVSVSYAFDQLQERNFIKITGVADLPGRPKLYRTTDEFLVQFGLGSLKELPTLEELRDLD
jgi:segregation and condensation protein B